MRLPWTRALTGLLLAASHAAAAPSPARALYRGVTSAVRFDVSPPLRSILRPPIVTEERPKLEGRPSGLEGPLGPQDADAVVQSEQGWGDMPSPLLSFGGPGNAAGVAPPDPVGDVGPHHYVVMSNLSFAVYDKAGALLLGPAANNTLWVGFGGPCENENAGDPVVLHDQLADRWILTQFTSAGPTYFNCVAVSTTADPTGTYFRFAFSTGGNFPDYPKYGVWPDALYVSTREFAGSGFAGVGAYAINRAQLIAGNPAPQVISFLLTPAAAGGMRNIGDGLLPSDLDGATPPPPGSPNLFVGSMDNGGPYGAPQDALTLWRFRADFAAPASSTFTLAHTLPVAAFDSMFPCGSLGRDCIPQPGTTNRIDILSYRQRLLHRLAYRNFGTHESLVSNQSVEASPGLAGVRWYELRDPNGTPVVFQQGTYAPGVTDGVHRFMGSAAMDGAGNLALGYSVSNNVTFPGVRYTGRLATDPPGTLPQGENVLIHGTGSQTGAQRWGDYTSMNVDPSDDCTFWYVNEHVPVTSARGWRLQIGSFRFPGCDGVPDFSLDCAPASLLTAPGASASTTCTVTSGAGYANAVALSCANLPAGVSCAANPNPVTPPANGSVSSAITFNVSGSVAAGLYDVQVRGSDGALVRSAPVRLEVRPPDFALNCGSALLPPWGGAAATCTITSQGGFSSPVTLHCLNPPPGVGCGANPNVVTPPPNGLTSSSIGFWAFAGAVPGAYLVNVHGVSGALVRQGVVSLNVLPGGFVTLAEPLDDGATGAALR